jgi:hypothetical protein
MVKTTNVKKVPRCPPTVKEKPDATTALDPPESRSASPKTAVSNEHANHKKEQAVMAKKAKSKRPVRGTGKHSKKKMAATQHRKASAKGKKAGPRARRAHPPAKKSTDVPSKNVPSILAGKPRPRRAFLAAAAPISSDAAPSASRPFPIKKKKKKQELVLRFNENTLKDIAALECVRRCFS